MNQQVMFLLSKFIALSSKGQSKTALRNYADYSSLATFSALVPQGGSEGLCCLLSSVRLNFHQCLYDTDFLRGHKDLCYGPLDEWVATPYQPRGDVLEPRPMSRKRVST